MENSRATIGSKNANAKVILFTSKVLANGEHPRMIKITKNRIRKYISIRMSCPLKFWDKAKELPKANHPKRVELIALINKLEKEFGTIYILSQIKNTERRSPLSQPFPLEGKGLYTHVGEVLPFKGKDLGWGISFCDIRYIIPKEFLDKIQKFNLELKDYTIDSLVDVTLQKLKSAIVVEYIDDLVANLKEEKRMGTAKSNNDCKLMLFKFHPDKNSLSKKLTTYFLQNGSHLCEKEILKKPQWRFTFGHFALSSIKRLTKESFQKLAILSIISRFLNLI
jgi:Arm DNA-binding domain